MCLSKGVRLSSLKKKKKKKSKLLMCREEYPKMLPDDPALLPLSSVTHFSLTLSRKELKVPNPLIPQQAYALPFH